MLIPTSPRSQDGSIAGDLQGNEAALAEAAYQQCIASLDWQDDAEECIQPAWLPPPSPPPSPPV